MASSTKTCRNWLTKEDVFKLRDVKIPEELKKRRKPIFASDDIKTELKRGEREVLKVDKRCRSNAYINYT